MSSRNRAFFLGDRIAVRAPLWLGVGLLAVWSDAAAQTRTFTDDSPDGSNWTDSGNWDPGDDYPRGSGALAFIPSGEGAVLDTSLVIGSLVIGEESGGGILNSSGSLLGVNSSLTWRGSALTGSGQLTVSGSSDIYGTASFGQWQVSLGSTTAHGGTFITAAGGSLTISGTLSLSTGTNFTGATGTGTPSLIINGAISKDAGSSVGDVTSFATAGLVVTNNGSMMTNSGELRFSTPYVGGNGGRIGTSSDNGLVQISGGLNIGFGHTHSFAANGGEVILNGGGKTFTNSGTAVAEGANQVRVEDVTVSGGSFAVASDSAGWRVDTDLTGTITVGGNFQWAGGEIADVLTFTPENASDTFLISSAGGSASARTLAAGAHVTTNGKVQQEASFNLPFSTSGLEALVDVRGEWTMDSTAGAVGINGVHGNFDVYDTFIKTSDNASFSGVINTEMNVHNGGRVKVLAGLLDVSANSDGNLQGIIEVDNSAGLNSAFQVDGGRMEDTTFQFSAGGTALMEDTQTRGTITGTGDGTATWSGTTVEQNTTANFSGASRWTQNGNLTLSDGTAFTTAGNYTWQGGNIAGPASGSGLFTNSGDDFVIEGTSSKRLVGAGGLSVVNTGVIKHQGGEFTDVYFSGGAHFTNDGTGIYEFQGDGDFTRDSNAANRITNNGRISKTAGTSSSSIDPELDNQGTVSVETGTLIVANTVQLDTSGSTGVLTGGTWQVADGATLRFAQGLTLGENRGNLELSGTGEMVGSNSSDIIADDFHNAGSVTHEEGHERTYDTYTQDHATNVDTTAPDFVAGTTPTTTVQGSGTQVTANRLEIVHGNLVVRDEGGVVTGVLELGSENDVTRAFLAAVREGGSVSADSLTLSGDGKFVTFSRALVNALTVVNNAEITLAIEPTTADDPRTHLGTSLSDLHNLSVGSHDDRTFRFDATTFTNSGMVSLQQGSLDLSDPEDPEFIELASLSEAVTAQIGTFLLEGDFIQTATGKLVLGLDTYLDTAVYDRVYVNGDATLDGTLQLEFTDDFSLTAGTTIALMEVTGTVSGVFSNLNENDYVTTIDGIAYYFTYLAGDGNDLGIYSVSAVPEPATVAALLGLAALGVAVRRRRSPA